MESWAVLSGVALAWIAQYLRGLTRVPTFVSYLVVIVFGFILFTLGYEGALVIGRKFVVEGFMWIAALLGIGRTLSDTPLAPKTNTIK